MTPWLAYLNYLRQTAQRTALREAILAPEDAPAPRPQQVDGQGGVQLEYHVVMETPPWDDLSAYEELAGGGEWHDNLKHEDQ